MVSQNIIKKQLNQYLKKVGNRWPIDEAYLVGSWAKDKAGENSDVDLLILSPSFKKMSFDDRLKVLYRQTIGIDFDLHIHPVTREEYLSASNLTSLGAMRSEQKISLVN